MGASPDPAVELVAGNERAVVRELKHGDGKDIWLCGGGVLASALFPEIDELILKVNPLLLGAGIPLFAGAVPPTALQRVSQTPYESGVTIVNYRVLHSAA